MVQKAILVRIKNIGPEKRKWPCHPLLLLFMRVSMIFLVFRCRGWYELVETPLSQIPLAYSAHFSIIFSPTSSKFLRGRHGQKQITGPRIGASVENVSPPTTGHQKGQKRSGVSVAKLFFPFLSERDDCKYFKACPSVKVFTQTFANLTCLW